MAASPAGLRFLRLFQSEGYPLLYPKWHRTALKGPPKMGTPIFGNPHNRNDGFTWVEKHQHHGGGGGGACALGHLDDAKLTLDPSTQNPQTEITPNESEAS